MFRGLSSLHELDIALDAKSSPLARSEIPAAIASLTSLRVLSLTELGTHTGADDDPVFVTALRHARSPLVSLCVSLPDHKDGVRYSRRRDPIFLSSSSRTTLERLQAGGRLNLIVRPGRTYLYPRLKQLILPLYNRFMPYLKPWIVSAPQLRDLQFGGTYNSHVRHRHDEDIFEGRIMPLVSTQECRGINERDQEANRWATLDSFKGAIIGAYASGLSCPIAQVHLLSTGGRRKMELAMLSTVLSDWRPSFLRLVGK